MRRSVVRMAMILIIAAPLTFFTFNAAKSAHGISSDFSNLPEAKQRNTLRAVAAVKGPEGSWSLLKEAYSAPDIATSRINPHDLAHFVGELFFMHRGLSGISECDVTFSAGCYHGLIVGLIKAEGKKSIVNLERLCEQAGMSLRWCAHGAGHGLGEMWKGNPSEAIVQCEAAFGSSASSCVEGVFMEREIQSPAGWQNDSWDSCLEEFASHFKKQCAEGKIDFLDIKKSLPELKAFCDSAPDPVLAEGCYGMLGVGILRNSKGQFDEIVAGCESLPALHQSSCFSYAASRARTDQVPDWQDIVSNLCVKVTESHAHQDCVAMITM